MIQPPPYWAEFNISYDATMSGAVIDSEELIFQIGTPHVDNYNHPRRPVIYL